MNNPQIPLRRPACMVLVRTVRWHRRRELVSQCLPGFLAMDDDDFLPKDSDEDWPGMHQLAVPDCLEAAALALSRGQDIAVIGDTATEESVLQYLRVASVVGARVAIIESPGDVISIPPPWADGWLERPPSAIACCLPVVSESECLGASFGAAIASLAVPVDPRLIEVPMENDNETRRAVLRSVGAVADQLIERLPGRAVKVEQRYCWGSGEVIVPLSVPRVGAAYARIMRSRCGGLVGWRLEEIGIDYRWSALAMNTPPGAREAATRKAERAALVGLSGKALENEKRRQRIERGDRRRQYNEERGELLCDYAVLVEDSSRSIAFLETGTAGDTADRIVEWVHLIESCSIPEGAERLRAIAAACGRPALIGALAAR